MGITVWLLVRVISKFKVSRVTVSVDGWAVVALAPAAPGTLDCVPGIPLAIGTDSERSSSVRCSLSTAVSSGLMRSSFSSTRLRLMTAETVMTDLPSPRAASNSL